MWTSDIYDGYQSSNTEPANSKSPFRIAAKWSVGNSQYFITSICRNNSYIVKGINDEAYSLFYYLQYVRTYYSRHSKIKRSCDYKICKFNR